MYAQVEILGFILELWSRLMVNSVCAKSLSHSYKGKSGWHVANPASKWVLNVHIAHSAALRRCWYGGTNLYVTLLSFSVFLNTVKYSLSSIYWLVITLLLTNQQWILFYVDITVSASLPFITSTKITLPP